jgi:hypothetical protein
MTFMVVFMTFSFPHSLPHSFYLFICVFILTVNALFFLQNNKGLKVVKDFRLALRRAQHAAIYKCFRTFNQKGGAVVKMQDGRHIYFARACILAIYADQPAARKCSLTGSACPVCYTPEKRMARADQEPRHALMRTEANMRKRKRILTVMSQTGARGCKERAFKKAKALGVNMVVPNAWLEGKSPEWLKVLGTCLRRDNIWQILPQPNLHGMDEGLNSKSNLGILEAVIKEAKILHNISATEVPAQHYTHSLHTFIPRIHCTCSFAMNTNQFITHIHCTGLSSS